jgi:hypothetical protein
MYLGVNFGLCESSTWSRRALVDTSTHKSPTAFTCGLSSAVSAQEIDDLAYSSDVWFFLVGILVIYVLLYMLLNLMLSRDHDVDLRCQCCDCLIGYRRPSRHSLHKFQYQVRTTSELSCKSEHMQCLSESRRCDYQGNHHTQ